MPRLDRAHQLVGELGVLGAAGIDVGKHADAAQEMLVHRVVVIHVELHHRDDAAEGAHEAAEHAGLVHPPQHGLGVVLRGQDFEEQPVRLLVLAQLDWSMSLSERVAMCMASGWNARLYFCAR